MTMKRTLALTAAALATTLTLAACGGSDDSATTGSPSDSPSSSAEASPATGEFSEADVMFAQMMIPHHAQAVDMSDTLLAKDDVDDDVRELAEQIKAAQEPEIQEMTGWLEDWDAEVPSTDGMDMGGDMAGMDHSGGGMMSPEDMAALEDATGAEAARLFLEQMTEHHTGAVEMARTELDEGTSPEAKDLAQIIIDTQEAEIEEMEDLLADL
jgi:uncharacterized protein (DUF305 family)